MPMSVGSMVATSHPVGEGAPDLVLRDAPRAPVARLVLAEAEQEEPSTLGDDGSEAVDVAGPVPVVEHVEETAVEDSVELLPEGGQREGVAHDEAGGQPPLARLGLGPPDGGRRQVDARRLQSGGRSHEGVLARAAAGVEHAALEAPLVGQRREGGLGDADVPRGRRLVGGLELGCSIHGGEV